MPDTLAKVCSSSQLETKWLLAPSLRIGHQWIETLVRRGQPVVNLQPTTVSRLALLIAGPELVLRELTPPGRGTAAAVVDAEWEKLPAEGYLGKLEPSIGVTASVSGAILSLRRIGVTADALNLTGFENPSKAADICQLLAAYEDFLKAQSLVDDADILRIAIRIVSEQQVQKDWLILIPSTCQVVGLEKLLLDAFPESSVSRIAVAPAETESAGPQVGLSRNRNTSFYRAIGPANEVREVFRRCVSARIPFDEVEILHTDSATYVPLIHALAHRYSDPDGNPVPVTFADGLPSLCSRPGRALVAWLNWIREDYPQRSLIELLAGGMLAVPQNDKFSTSYLVQLLRPLAIGLGADNYRSRLDAAIEATKGELAKRSIDAEDAAGIVASCEKRIAGYTVLQKFLAQLLDVSKTVCDNNGATPLTAAELFLTKLARSAGEIDQKACAALIGAIRDRRVWMETLEANLDSVPWLMSLPAQTPVTSSGPKSGHLHVAHVNSGGHSGRSKTFVVGLDDQRFPGAALQDPILLDHERQQLHPELPLSVDRLHEKIADLESTLSRLTGHITLSWSCHDPVDDREMYPAAILFSVWRSITGNQKALPEAFADAVGQPVSFAPDSAEKPLDETEHWLWRLSDPVVSRGDHTAIVQDRYRHLARGTAAVLRRYSEFGPFSGHVAEAGIALNPFDADGPVLSASSLETAGRCPLAYFFQKGLRIAAPDDTELDFDRWLDAAQFGSLMHDVFRQFMKELRQVGKLPDFDRDHTQLAAILQDAVEQWRRDVPPPNDNAYRTDLWKLARTSRIFLQMEDEFCRTSTPRFFEAAIGLESVGSGNPLDDTEPAVLQLANGRSIRTRGQVDRIDELGPERFSIWDYKIASGYGYDPNDPFRQGRHVQSVLYLKMVNEALRRHPDLKGVVERFGYFFPSIRAQGLRIDWPAESLRAGDGVVASLCGSIAAGEFPATDDKNDCTFCDYATVCRDLDQVTQTSRESLNRTAPEATDTVVPLTFFRELRRG